MRGKKIVIAMKHVTLKSFQRTTDKKNKTRVDLQNGNAAEIPLKIALSHIERHIM